MNLTQSGERRWREHRRKKTLELNQQTKWLKWANCFKYINHFISILSILKMRMLVKATTKCLLTKIDWQNLEEDYFRNLRIRFVSICLWMFFLCRYHFGTENQFNCFVFGFTDVCARIYGSAHTHTVRVKLSLFMYTVVYCTEMLQWIYWKRKRSFQFLSVHLFAHWLRQKTVIIAIIITYYISYV